MGTGFVTMNEKTVVTNFHLFKWFESDIFIQVQNRFGEELLFVRATHFSALDDLAVLQVENYKGPSLTLHTLSNREEFLSSVFCLFSFKMVCDNVYIPGFPMGDFAEIEGQFRFSLDDLSLYSLDTQFPGALSGASGSPVLNDQGEVIGILAKGIDGEGGFAIPVDNLNTLLQNPALSSTEKLETLIREERARLITLAKEGNMRALHMLNAWIRSN